MVNSGTGTLTLDGWVENLASLANTGSGTLSLTQLGSARDILTNVDLALRAGGTYSGVISGTGRVVVSGSGTSALTATNTHTGGVSVVGGTLSVDRDANLGAAGGILTLSSAASLVATTSMTLNRSVALENGLNGGHPGDMSASSNRARPRDRDAEPLQHLPQLRHGTPTTLCLEGGKKRGCLDGVRRINRNI